MNAIGSARALLRLCAATLAVLAIAAACTSGGSGTGSLTGASTHSQALTPPARAAAQPAECRQWACRERQSADLPGNYRITLWLGGDERNYRSRPVVELRLRGVPVQWWISPKGDGWNGTLTCLPHGYEPNCILIDSLGMHASVAEMLILREGRLINPPGAEAITNSPGMTAVDLEGVGYLEVIGTTNDYRPNFAQGHEYWETFGWDGRLVPTGCAPKTAGSPPPTRLLRGACPTATSQNAPYTQEDPVAQAIFLRYLPRRLYAQEDPLRVEADRHGTELLRRRLQDAQPRIGNGQERSAAQVREPA